MRKKLARALVVGSILAFSVLFVVLGPKILQAAAPTGGRLMKFAVQRANGIAWIGGVGVVSTYLGIGLAGFLQSRCDERQES